MEVDVSMESPKSSNGYHWILEYGDGVSYMTKNKDHAIHIFFKYRDSSWIVDLKLPNVNWKQIQ